MILFRRRPKSTKDALGQIVGKRLVRELEYGVLDKREFVQYVARHVEGTETELTYGVAEKMGLPYLPRLEPINIDLLPEQTPFEVYERAGAILVIQDGQAVGVACIDPSRLFKVMPIIKERGSRIYISPWSEIKRALTESVSLRHSKEAANITQAPKQQEEATSLTSVSVLKAALTSVASYDSAKLEILFDDEVTYSFELADGQIASGVISETIRESLKSLLKQSQVTSLPQEVVQVEPGGWKLRLVEHGYEIYLPGRESGLPEGFISEPKVHEIQEEKSGSVTDATPAQSSVEAPQSPILTGEERVEASIVENDTVVSVESLVQESLGNTSPVTVLIVDDAPAYGMVLQKTLEKRGLQAITYTEPERALEDLKAGKINPDIVVSDFHMPRMTGAEFVREIRKLPRRTQTPIIVLTSDDDCDTELMAVEGGADLYLRKDQHIKILSAHVKRFSERIKELKEEKKAA